RLDHFSLDRIAAAIRFPADRDRAGAREVKVLRAILVAEAVARDNDRLVPVRDDARHVAADDRLTEDGAIEDVADGPVRRPPHLLQVELLDPRLVRRDGGALDGDAMLPRRVRGVDGDLVAGAVARFNPEVEIFEVDVEVRKDQRLTDLLPDDARH